MQYPIFAAITSAFQEGKIARGLDHNFISLIPKKYKPQSTTDYHPISCANVLYKIISKIICFRIEDFLPYLIAENQSAFVPRRNIGENVLLPHKVVQDFKKKGNPKMCVKIDLQKAYDMVNRKFACYMLHTMGFPLSMVKLIYECISTPTFSIMVDGTPHRFIASTRGLWQDDPLSPYLLYVAMEFFSLFMEDASQLIQPISSIQPIISHLLYADDVMIFLSATTSNVITMNTIFN